MFARVIAPSALFLAGLVMAIMFLVRGQAGAALGALLCGAIIGGIVNFGFMSMCSDVYKIACGLVATVAVVTVLFSSNLFNTPLQRAYAEAFTSFLHMETGAISVQTLCPEAAPALTRLASRAVNVCPLQHNVDAMGATVELSKGVQFGPGLSMVDSAATLAQDKEVNYCARVFMEAYRACPLAFSSMESGSVNVLFEAGK